MILLSSLLPEHGKGTPLKISWLLYHTAAVYLKCLIVAWPADQVPKSSGIFPTRFVQPYGICQVCVCRRVYVFLKSEFLTEVYLRMVEMVADSPTKWLQYSFQINISLYFTVAHLKIKIALRNQCSSLLSYSPVFSVLCSGNKIPSSFVVVLQVVTVIIISICNLKVNYLLTSFMGFHF